jgi:chitodextrinase
MSPNGSADAACTQDDPCASLRRAYAEARPGNVVLLAAGTYGNQVLPLDRAKDRVRRVVFRPAPGARVQLGDVEVRARGVQLERVTVSGWSTRDTADGVTFRDVTVRGGISVHSSSNVAMRGGSVGPGNDYSPLVVSDSAATPPSNIVFDGVTFHDWRRTDGVAEVQCLRIDAVNGLEVRNSRFSNCESGALLLRKQTASLTPTNVTIENNFLGCCASGTFSLSLGDGSGENWQNVLVRNNSSTRPLAIGPRSTIGPGVRFYANVLPSVPRGACRASVAVDYNVYASGSRCGPHDVVARSPFADAGTGDFHLTAGAGAIDRGDPASYPATDIDGDARPRGGTPDAGADEVRFGPAPDARAPTAPTGLTKSGGTASSIDVSWTAADDVGVTGYGTYLDGALVASTTGTTATYTGLTCGTRYALAVYSVDAAGNRSLPLGLAASTSACAAASVFVAPSGSDANPCTQTAPCASFDRAYRVAQPGQVVELAAGTYANQLVRPDATKTSTTDVVFQPAAGAGVTVGSKPQSQRLRGGTGVGVDGAKHLTFRNFNVRGDVVASTGADDVTFRNLVSPNGLPAIYAPTSNVAFRGGSYGNTLRYMVQVYPGGSGQHNYNVVFDGVVLHDVRSDDLANYHVECMLVSDAIGGTFRKLKTYNCDVFDLSLGVFGGGVLSNILVEDNMFASTGPTVDSSLGLNTNTRSWNGLNVRNNSTIAYMRHPDCTNGCTNVRYSGNVSRLFGSWQCVGQVTYRDNVWTRSNGQTCNTTDLAVADPAYVNPGGADLHLRSGSPALNQGDPTNAPPIDFDNQPRPLGPAPDAGADEAG